MNTKTFKTSMSVDRIEIVQSLEPHEDETGQELFDLVNALDTTVPMPTRRLTKVNSANEFFHNLRVIEDKVEGGKGLILHFDIHGSDDQLGLILSNDDFISWEDVLYLSDIFNAIPEYYSEWARSGNGSLASETLNNNSSNPFVFSTAERIFRLVMQRVFAEKDSLSEEEQEKILERCRSRFFALDSVPDLSSRIGITLEDFDL